MSRLIGVIKLFVLISVLIPASGIGQFVDDFSDGNFTLNPSWTGDTASFEVDGNFELHLNATAVSDEAYLSTPSVAVNSAVWEATVRMDFNPSSQNRTRIYLISNTSNLEQSLNGYFVQLGNTEDEISLYRQTGSSIAKIIDGPDDMLDESTVSVHIRATRSTLGEWQLFADTALSDNYVLLGATIDTAHTTSDFFGIWCDYTSTRSDRFYFDDLLVTGSADLDTVAPIILSTTALGPVSLQVVFNESIDSISATREANYRVNPSTASPTSVQMIGDSAVRLAFSNHFLSGTTYTLAANNVQDLHGNTTSNIEAIFTYYNFGTPDFRDIVINEIMADYNPAVGLPEREFVELYNTSRDYFDMSLMQFADEKDTIDLPNNIILEPGEYAIVCNDDDTALFSEFGKLITLSPMPVLNNDADDLKLLFSDKLIDRVAYTDMWYINDDKRVGGYTLEQINPTTPCGGQNNWAASAASIGGTPGGQNSIYDASSDTIMPIISGVNIISTQVLEVVFSKNMDSASLTASSFELINGPAISTAKLLTRGNAVELSLASSIDSTILYSFTFSSDLKDCLGNSIQTDTLKLGIGVSPKQFDIIINEVYPDPEDNGQLPFAEFVEVYNRSSKLINLNGLSIADRSGNADLRTGLLAPNAYAIICDDQYAHLFQPFGKVLPVGNMPSLNNSDDDISLVLDSTVIDQLTYTDAWFGDIQAKGNSLERINLENLCGQATNWQPSENALGGTPGVENSLFIFAEADGTVILSAQFLSLDSIAVQFDQRIHQQAAPLNFTANGAPLITNSSPPSTLIAVTKTPFVRGEQYTITIDSLKNCAGVKSYNLTTEIYLHKTTDVVINEVLSNPRESGTDFVELYNQSDFPIDLQDWSLGYSNSKDSLRFNQITNVSKVLEAGAYLALNEDSENLVRNYPNSVGSDFLIMDLPSYSNNTGSVLLYDQMGLQIEAFHYSQDLHFALIDNPDGVSLERLSASRPASDNGNWHSASSTENYATPGYINSQDYGSISATSFTLSGEHISPDNDGYQDVVNIEYSLDRAGQIASVEIYNDRGFLVKSLFTNQVLGSSGSLTWDGTNDDGEKAKTGIHLVVIETFDLNGNREHYRLPIVVATRF